MFQVLSHYKVSRTSPDDRQASICLSLLATHTDFEKRLSWPYNTMTCLEVIIWCFRIVQEQPQARLVHLHLFSVERLKASYLYRLLLKAFCLPIEPYQQRDKQSSKCQDGHVDDGVSVQEQPEFGCSCTPDAEYHGNASFAFFIGER